jgi:predicted ATPase
MSTSSGAVAGDLLERERELAAADRALDRVAGGSGAVLVFNGPAGIGKSELLAAVEAAAQARGFGVLRARGSEFEEEIAFGISRQLFEPMLRAASPGEWRRLVDGVAQVGVRALGMDAAEPPADRFAALHWLYWLCANRAERGPLVVAIDDAQWTDNPSLTWLGYLARRTSDLALLAAVTLRSGIRELSGKSSPEWWPTGMSSGSRLGRWGRRRSERSCGPSSTRMPRSRSARRGPR